MWLSASDPAFAHYTDVSELPEFIRVELKNFFQEYKKLENKKVAVEDFIGKAEAVQIVKEAVDLYKKHAHELRNID